MHNRPYHSGGGAVWGVIFLVAGIVLLLQVLNILPWGLWAVLWRFWPVFIIILGLYILLRHSNPWVLVIITVILLGLCVGGALVWHNVSFSVRHSGEAFCSQHLGDMKKADIGFDFSAGSLNVGSLPVGSTKLFEATSSVRDGRSTMKATYQPAGPECRVKFQTINQQYWPGRGVRWNVDFSPDIPLSFDIESSAGSLNLDLSNLKVSEANLILNASTCTLNLPSSEGVMEIYAKVNVATLKISLPENIPARIKINSNVSLVNVDKRFTREGDYYVVRGPDSSTQRIEIDIDCNVSTVEIR